MLFAIKKRAACAVLTGATCLFGSLSAWAGIPITHWTHANGAQVYWVHSPAIPMVDVQVDLDAGGRRDPADKAGLASLMASALDYGVRATPIEAALDENALSEAWADLGAGFGASAGSDRMSFSLRSLTEPQVLAQAIALAARQLGQPSFPDAVWQRERAKWVASLKEADTRPDTIAARAYNQAVYGSHPYGYELTAASLARIRVADFRSLHAQVVRPCAAKVSVVGALERAQVDALVAQLFARVPAASCSAAANAADAARPVVPEVQPLQQATEKRITFAAAQAQVYLGQPGIRRNSGDFFAMLVGNHILGGSGFGSRLTEAVREKRGLTYGISSSFSPGLHAGAFTISFKTRPDQADQALALTRQVLQEFVAQGPTEAELQAAKANLVGGFALRIDSNRKLLDNVANIAWNGLPLDYLDTWSQRIEALTVQDIRSAWARTVRPEALATVVLGATSAPAP
jgi:zinc protease